MWLRLEEIIALTMFTFISQNNIAYAFESSIKYEGEYSKFHIMEFADKGEVLGYHIKDSDINSLGSELKISLDKYFILDMHSYTSMLPSEYGEGNREDKAFLGRWFIECFQFDKAADFKYVMLRCVAQPATDAI